MFNSILKIHYAFIIDEKSLLFETYLLLNARVFLKIKFV